MAQSVSKPAIFIAVGLTISAGVVIYLLKSESAEIAPHKFGNRPAAQEPNQLTQPEVLPDAAGTLEQMRIININFESLQGELHAIKEENKQLKDRLNKQERNDGQDSSEVSQMFSDQLNVVQQNYENLANKLAAFNQNDNSDGLGFLPDEVPKDGVQPVVGNDYGLPQLNRPNGNATVDDNDNYGGDFSASEQVVWQLPIDAVKGINDDGVEYTYVPKLKQGNASSIPIHEEFDNGSDVSEKEAELIPYMTIPPTTTLVGAVTQSAILAKVPIGSTVVAPMKFTVKLGPEVLVSKGFSVDGVADILAIGTAIGNRSLKCAEANIDTLQFTFEDGRVTTVRSEDSESGQLGYLTDMYGVPCITADKYISNLPEYLTTNGLLAVAQGITEGYQAAQTSSSPSDGGSSAVDGNKDTYALANSGSAGIQSVIDTMKERQDSMFDVAYVAVGKLVDIRITEQIEIDYDPNGRKLNYEVPNDFYLNDFN
ncbi:hypothetical protein [Shewanella sp. MBTL60-007]|uniref:hypothetical protein n=1 Tax=Shewanella sp. MBTL60-007 TaxID=2815911 RepID=UPI001BBCAFE8|nr:hypothetical protein [Shewanella sp. MBTL60-007]GIU20877.1 integrating conjugative element protein [Shewanella sp. MBTL60-007]